MSGTTFILGLLLVSAVAVEGAVLHVPLQYPTIQAAVDACASSGDSILIAAGNYPEDVAVTGKVIVFVGESGADNTRLTSLTWQAMPRASPARLEGLHLTGGVSSVGDYLRSPVCISDCVIDSAVTLRFSNNGNSWTELKGCVFGADVSASGMGSSFFVNVVSDCVFLDSADLMFIVFLGSLAIERCAFDGGTLTADADEPSTVANNSLAGGDGIVLLMDGVVVYQNDVRGSARGISIAPGYVFGFADVRSNSLTDCSVGIAAISGGGLTAEENVIVGCTVGIDVISGSMARVGRNVLLDCGVGIRYDAISGEITGNTVVGCSGEAMRIESSPYPYGPQGNLVVQNGQGIVLGAGPHGGWIPGCNNVWNNPGGNWIGTSDPTGVNGNISADPLFCDSVTHQLGLAASSPCLPGNHPDGWDCGLIGALGDSCQTPLAAEERASPAEPLLLMANPYVCGSPITMNEPLAGGRASISVFDLGGRLVRRLHAEGVAASAMTVSWDGQTDFGGAAARGVYFIKVRRGTHSACQSFVLTR